MPGRHEHAEPVPADGHRHRHCRAHSPVCSARAPNQRAEFPPRSSMSGGVSVAVTCRTAVAERGIVVPRGIPPWSPSTPPTTRSDVHHADRRSRRQLPAPPHEPGVPPVRVRSAHARRRAAPTWAAGPAGHRTTAGVRRSHTGSAAPAWRRRRAPWRSSRSGAAHREGSGRWRHQRRRRAVGVSCSAALGPEVTLSLRFRFRRGASDRVVPAVRRWPPRSSRRWRRRE